jgi:hypothetical protein
MVMYLYSNHHIYLVECCGELCDGVDQVNRASRECCTDYLGWVRETINYYYNQLYNLSPDIINNASMDKNHYVTNPIPISNFNENDVDTPTFTENNQQLNAIDHN